MAEVKTKWNLEPHFPTPTTMRPANPAMYRHGLFRRYLVRPAQFFLNSGNPLKYHKFLAVPPKFPSIPLLATQTKLKDFTLCAPLATNRKYQGGNPTSFLTDRVQSKIRAGRNDSAWVSDGYLPSRQTHWVPLPSTYRASVLVDCNPLNIPGPKCYKEEIARYGRSSRMTTPAQARVQGNLSQNPISPRFSFSLFAISS